MDDGFPMVLDVSSGMTFTAIDPPIYSPHVYKKCSTIQIILCLVCSIYVLRITISHEFFFHRTIGSPISIVS